MWTIFKVFTEFVTILLLFYVLFIGLEVCGLFAPCVFSFLHYSICRLVLQPCALCSVGETRAGLLIF